MKICGIIAEFNPFHNGHKYLLDTMRKQQPNSVFVVAMSGNFTQRGEAALFDKWHRAKMAVLGGADLVIELPSVFVIRSAEAFGHGAVNLFQKLNCIDNICFGSENADITILNKIAALLDTPLLLHTLLPPKLKKGLPYAAAIAEIISQYIPQAATLLKEPNIILAVEYLRAMHQLETTFTPIAIKRKTAHHNDTKLNGEISSATAIRNILLNHFEKHMEVKQSVPEICYDYMIKILKSSNDIARLNRLSRVLLAKLRLSNIKTLTDYPGVTNGLEYKLLHSAVSGKSIDDIMSSLKSKHYHHSRLSRSLLYILMHMNTTVLSYFDKIGPCYARVLAFNKNGRKILRKINSQATIPVVLKTTHFLSQKCLWQSPETDLQQMLSYDIAATDLYGLCFQNIQNGGRDFYTSPIYIS
ncbi:tRNA(Met) cytidine acetate ligase [Pectinatus sottacetonis]|uniref:tRNA(Met) cytidine acetate ligase n=1 Tax=Pectinatus sottacetonis TaxID=1002795 RepID=UPI0018C67B8C|nr:nucleotidyltransferase family protein [Pectinatus sottacetonis]